MSEAPAELTEAGHQRALKRLARLEKQNALLVDELVRARQCVQQMKAERNVILDRYGESALARQAGLEDDSDSDPDADADEDAPAHRRTLLDELVDAMGDEEAFARSLQAVAAQAAPLDLGAHVGARRRAPPAPGTGAQAKRRTSAQARARFNRLSPATQAMRRGIVSDDEAGAPGAAHVAPDGDHVLDDLDEALDAEDADADDDELAALRRARADAGPARGAAPPPEPVLKVIPVPVHPATGLPLLPLSLNMITVHALGTVLPDRPQYHSKRYILPVGFVSSRAYLSCTDPADTCTYISTILDHGPAPLYQVTPEGRPELRFTSPSSTGAWAAVARAAAAIRGKDAAASISGPDYFGLSNPTVQMLIERLPGADLCASYLPKKYEVSMLVGGKQAKRAIEDASLSPTSDRV